MTYAAMGKQVLLDGTHYADARDPVVAQQIVEALRLREDLVAWNDVSPMHPDQVVEITPIAADAPRRVRGMVCQVTQQQDEYACTCGRRWDVADGPEHP